MSKKETKTPRILTFDLLRGYFMVSIILNHLQWYPNGLDWVAFRGSLFVSAAEGFFLISGIVLGIVRSRKLMDKSFKTASKLLLARGARLYIISITLMLFFTLAGWLFMDNPGLKPGIRPLDQPMWEIMYGALTLQYIYGWADFLRLYAMFLIVSPLAVLLLRKNLWYILMAISLAIWATFPAIKEATGMSSELLLPISWQLIFFAGLTIGHHWQDMVSWWGKLAAKTRKWILLPTITLAATTLILNIALLLIPAMVGEDKTGVLHTTLRELWPLFSKDTLSPLRLILFGLWFILGFYIFNRYEKQILKWFGWILMPFGLNSLYVYIMHAVILFFAHLIIAPYYSSSILLNGLGVALVLGIILLATKKQFLFKVIPR